MVWWNSANFTLNKKGIEFQGETLNSHTFWMRNIALSVGGVVIFTVQETVKTDLFYSDTGVVLKEQCDCQIEYFNNNYSRN